jgi:RND family efflux transporter MFP subunit
MTDLRRLCWLSLVLASAATLAGCGRNEHPAAATPETVRGLSVLEVKSASVADRLEAVGTVRAASTSAISSRAVANILEVRVREGDRVRRGQALVVIDSAQPAAALEGAQAALAAARQQISAAAADYGLADATFRRYQDLYNKKSVSPQEFDEIKARREMALARRESARAAEAQAQAGVQQAQVGVNDTTLRAPFDGVVIQKTADPGMLATPGLPLLVIEDTRSYRLEASIDEGEMHWVRPGQTVEVSLEVPGGGTLSGQVTEIVPTADASSRTFTVKVQLPADSLIRSGLFGRARFPRGERQAVRVPRSAVIERGQLEALYVIGSDGIATLRYVTLGKPSGDQVEVLSGLVAGERIVAAPGGQELAGKRIEVQP